MPRVRLKIKQDRTSKLGYSHIEIMTPNIEPRFHLCNTERGLIAIAAQDLLRDLEHYQRIPNRDDLLHIVRGSLDEFIT